MVKVQKASLKNSDQNQLMKLISDALKSNSGPLKDIFGSFDKGAFDQGIANPAMKNFQENILPMIQEKFIGGNQAGGSGIQRASLKAGTDLQSQLAALLYQAQEGQKQNRIGGAQNLIGQQTFENIVQQPKPKTSLLSSLLPVLGTAAGAFLGPGGALAGMLGSGAGATAAPAVASLAGNSLGSSVAQSVIG